MEKDRLVDEWIDKWKKKLNRMRVVLFEKRIKRREKGIKNKKLKIVRFEILKFRVYEREKKKNWNIENWFS